jgi:predicted nuclease of predicted toxin-antitoxin system
VKLLIDMNMSRRWIAAFIEAGIQAIHWSEVGDVRASDAEIMEHASVHGQIIFTKDLDFGAMLAESRRLRPSVVQVRAENASPEIVGLQVMYALRSMEDELSRGALLTVEAENIRLRLLPFGRRVPKRGDE